MSGQPIKYVQVADALRAAIDDGSIKPGEWLTIGEVASQYHVGLQTAEHALNLLTREGRLAPWRGLGHLRWLSGLS
jgi:DNA-binding GntR family transcriptional regulator